jgi:2-polyprenyl-6-methoxyphenol hydroxylase-like FAD-dependent oxidoreductase
MERTMSEQKHGRQVLVVGAGAAGMMAAVTAARAGAAVTVVEPNEKVGRKLYITGKGRCNVTNACSLDEVMASIPRNSKFLYSALSRFTPQDTMRFFESLGVPLKTECSQSQTKRRISSTRCFLKCADRACPWCGTERSGWLQRMVESPE